MSFIRSIILLGIAATTSYASPLSLNLFNRDGGACYPESMTIDQPDQNCPKKNTLDSSGHCSATIPNVPGSHGCTAYCELTLAVGYGQEVPITEGSCQELTSCVVTTGQSVTVTHSYSISTKVGLSSTDNLVDILTSAFELGASYSWSKAIAYTVTTSHTETLKANQCGYWTFIPYVMTSCGTLTSTPWVTVANKRTVPLPGSFPTCSKKTYKDTTNWCNKAPYKDANGFADGVVIFVHTDCKTNAVLKAGQMAPYNYPGVSTGPKRK